MEDIIQGSGNYPFTKQERMIFAGFLLLIVAIGSLSNSIVLVLLYKECSLRKTTATIFLVNLIIIDMCNLLIVMPVSLVAIFSSAWHVGKTAVQLVSFIGTTLELVSMLALAIISLDRLAAVMKPLQYRARMTITKAMQWNLYIWFQAVAFSLIPIKNSWYIFNRRYYTCTLHSYSRDSGFYVYMSFFILCNFASSLFLILVTYFYIFRVARGHSKRISNSVLPRNLFNMNRRKDSLRQREVYTACKILFVITAFILCHAPYIIIRIKELFDKTDEQTLPVALTVASKWAAYSKSALDPFIYCLLQKRFQKVLRHKLFNRTERASRQIHSLRETKTFSIMGDKATNNDTTSRRTSKDTSLNIK